jgi:hypothetical protein
MMVDLTILLDIAFLLLAIYLFPSLPGGAIQESTQSLNTHHDIKQIDTPLPSPAPVLQTGSVPRIILHASHVSSSSIPVSLTARPRPGHKAKSVSFSISSMNDLLPLSSSPEEVKQRRPPTPWMRGPASPSEIKGLLAGSDENSSMPSPFVSPIQQSLGERKGSLGVMVQDPNEEDEGGEDLPLLLSPKICSRDVMDTMGVKKAWLMS